jgi:diguanylate cyclase (GGDEF)-like protein
VLTPEDVWREALMSIGEITPFDLAAFTTFDPETEVHTITQVETSPDWNLGVADWVGQEFEANGGWVSMVVKNRHYLPYGGHVRDGAPVVFGKKQRISGMRSMLVLPLIAQDKVLGTLVVGHREANRYTTERREMLEVVSNQVAVSLQSANLYACMERMATRDALTGLPNRRTFMGRIEEAVARHRRSGGTFGLILSDIDHFKSVNDTYGHPVGDEVLRQVASAFRETLRETDMPARYGGEEFIILLEETDMKGCEILANRVREAVSELTFQSDKGPFQCTISMGIAIWPSDHEDTSELIELADQALYHSKKNGRNRVTVYDTMPAK